MLRLALGNAMSWRSSASATPLKASRRKAVRPKRRNAPKVARRRRSSSPDLIEKVALFKRERDESLEQQKATAEVLRIISASPGDLKPIFAVILENATRLCQANFGVLFLCEGDAYRAVAMHNAPSAYVEARRREPLVSMTGTTVIAEVARTKRTIQTADMAKNPAYRKNPQYTQLFVRLTGARSFVGVPMLKDDTLIGVIGIFRQEVRQFTDKQVELVENFAAQAVIAIENTRLLSELRQSLEQQTATADVLRVISSSPGDLQPVFQAMLESATRICEARLGNLLLFDGKDMRVVAMHNAPREHMEMRRRNPVIPLELSICSPVIRTKKLVVVADITAEEPYASSPLAKAGGARTALAVPMLRETELVGVITIYRQDVRPFTAKQIELVTNFAAQAVIAIENTRLLSELRQSLEQQTATSDVLRVISSSPGELEPVFQAMLVNATRICEAEFGFLWLAAGDGFKCVALHGVPAYFVKLMRKNPVRHPGPLVPLRRVAATKQVVHSANLLEDPAYAAGDIELVKFVELTGARTHLLVPMLKDNEFVGAISIYRTEIRLFTDKQVALVTNFASQAVIAIENARLLNELRQSLEQQTATADVLRVISSSPGDLKPVFDEMLANAVRICQANFGTLFVAEGDKYRTAAGHNMPSVFLEERQRTPISMTGDTALARVARTKQPVQIPDVAEESAYRSDPQRLSFVSKTGARTVICVPMLKDDKLVGAVAIYRQEVRPFADNQIDLLTNFAAQAVIAIENTRLLNELRQRTSDLTQSLEDLRTAQDRLVQTEKLASLGQLTAGIAHEIKNPLNFVNNFSGLSVELVEELEEGLKGVTLDDKRRAEFGELTETLRGNLQKVVQHGQRADVIVKNMLLHSRQGSSEHRPVDINALVEESLNLAYHGARAEKQGFNITLERSFDPAAGQADVFPQDITRVLLNLISNGFYAATKRKVEANGGDYQPSVTAATKNLGDRVEIRIRDNGTGIPPEVREKIFNPFFTTKPAGEGTGLGLSISHDIIVKQHLGSIEVDTEPGAFTEFRIVLPRATSPR